MKLYFMVGLPSEREEDLLEIVRLSREALAAGKAEKKGRFHLTISLSSFIPKPHTPFQWVEQAPIGELKEKHYLLRDRLRGQSFTLKWQLPEMSLLEAAFARGDRILGGVLARAHALGCRFDGWTDQFRFDLWQAAFSDLDVDPKTYSYRRFETEASLPWDHISANLSKDFLLTEYQKAFAGEVSPDCQVASCLRCGLACPSRPTNSSFSGPSPAGESGEGAKDPEADPASRHRIRFTFEKGEEVRFLSHLEILRTIARALRRAALPISYSQGFHPQPRLAIAWALPVGVCGEAELGEMELEGEALPPKIEDRLNRHLPLGLRVVRADPVPLASPALEGTLSRALYTLSLGEEEAEEWGAQNPLLFSPDSPRSFLKEASISMLTRRKEKEILVEVRPLILDFFLQEGVDLPTWQLDLRLNPTGGINPIKLMARFFSNYLDEDKAGKLVLGLKITRKALL